MPKNVAHVTGSLDEGGALCEVSPEKLPKVQEINAAALEMTVQMPDTCHVFFLALVFTCFIHSIPVEARMKSTKACECFLGGAATT